MTAAGEEHEGGRPSLGSVQASNSSLFDASVRGSDDLLGSTAESLRELVNAEHVAIFRAGEGEPATSTTRGPLPRTPGQPTLKVPLRAGDREIGHIIMTRTEPFGHQHAVLASLLAGQLAIGLGRAEKHTEADAWRAEARRSQDQLAAYAHDIRFTFKAEKERANQLAAALGELEASYLATVNGLAAAVEAKDEYTLGHLVRVKRYGLAMVTSITGETQPARHYEEGFLLHDIGKLAIPDGILKKTGSLDDQESKIMRTHVDIGYRILKNIPFLAEAREIVLGHHERWDGRGYPVGVEGESIPLGARLFPVADSFDAMTSDRPYRRAMPIDDAFAELEKGAGGQFWPEAVEAFMSLPRDEVEDITHTTDESLLSLND